MSGKLWALLVRVRIANRCTMEQCNISTKLRWLNVSSIISRGRSKKWWEYILKSSKSAKISQHSVWANECLSNLNPSRSQRWNLVPIIISLGFSAWNASKDSCAVRGDSYDNALSTCKAREKASGAVLVTRRQLLATTADLEFARNLENTPQASVLSTQSSSVLC